MGLDLRDVYIYMCGNNGTRKIACATVLLQLLHGSVGGLFCLNSNNNLQYCLSTLLLLALPCNGISRLFFSKSTYLAKRNFTFLKSSDIYCPIPTFPKNISANWFKGESKTQSLRCSPLHHHRTRNLSVRSPVRFPTSQIFLQDILFCLYHISLFFLPFFTSPLFLFMSCSGTRLFLVSGSRANSSSFKCVIG